MTPTKLATLLILLLSTITANAATDVWLFYGWGPNGFSSGIDEIARRVRRLRGVHRVTVMDYLQTQLAYDQARHSPPNNTLVFGGYSCGGNSSLAVGSALGSRNVHVIALQPSEWCGRYRTTPNMRYFQDTWSRGTFGLGSYQPEGPPAYRTVFIERPDRHLAADTDPLYQRDMVFAIGAIADPSRRWLMERHLRRSAPHVDRRDAQVIWLRE